MWYLLPNFFTALSAFLGVISIIASLKGEIEKATYIIFLSVLLDGVDGRLARLTKTTSKFGLEFDSLADIVAFGVAPAILFYQAIGYELGKFGVLVTALYVVFGAIRLARFNVMIPSTEPSVFVGVPIPSAAVFVASWVLLFQKYHLYELKGVIALMVFGVSFLMVSNIRYPSFKKLPLKRSHLLKMLVIMVVFMALLYLYPAEVLTFSVTGFIVAGVVRAIYFLLTRKIRYNSGKRLSRNKKDV